MGRHRLDDKVNRKPFPHCKNLDNRGGFTLTEVMIASVVIGIGVSAALFGMSSSLDSSGKSQDMLTAMSLAENLFQLAQGLEINDPDGGEGFGPDQGESSIDDYDDVDDLDGSTFTPPLDAAGVEIESYAGWSQEVDVFCLDLESMERLETPENTGLIEMEVNVFRGVKRVGCFRRVWANR